MTNTPCFHGWKIVRRIGGGHFGAVYEIEKEAGGGFDTETEHSAMKVISIPPSEDELESLQEEYGDDETVTTLLRSQVDDIAKEFKLMSKLQGQSNIVSYHDHEIVQQDNGLGWDVLIRMELLTSLSAHSNEHAMDKNEIVRLGIDICKALERCEMHNILHRDIKPQNIFVNADGDFKLGDFGVARVSEHMTASTVAGTYTYMAPEVYQNKENYDKRADIYSLGLVLYWLLNERRDPFLPLPPAKFTSKDKNAAFQKRIEGVSLPRPAHGSPKLQAVVLKACAFAREDRFSSAAEMRKALESLSAGEKTHMEIKEPPVPEIHTDSPKIGSDDETVDGRDKVSEKASGKPNSSAGKLGDTVSAFHRANDETVYDAKSESQEPEPVKKEPQNGDKPIENKKPLLIAAACVGVVLVGALMFALGRGTSTAEYEAMAENVTTAVTAVTTVPPTMEIPATEESTIVTTEAATIATTEAATIASTEAATIATTEMTEATVAEEFMLSSDLSVGSTFEMGYYGSQTLRWRILEKSNDKMLVLCEDGIDSRRYHYTNESVTWATCSLRSWLNDTFYYSAFSDSEQNYILTTNVDSIDCKLYLLSTEEVSNYFGSSQSSRICRATTYAVSQGAYVNSSTGGSWWLLRTPGDDNLHVASVNSDGTIDYSGGRVESDKGVVRPAMWVSLE